MNESLICPMPCPKPGSGMRHVRGEQVMQDQDAAPLDDSPPLTAREPGLVSYMTDIRAPLSGCPVRCGEVLYLTPEGEESCTFVKATLILHCKGIIIEPQKTVGSKVSIAWTPFTLVQACRLHTVKADSQLRELRLFKVSIFQHGLTVFFATSGDQPDMERTRWVADISRGIRALTKSLFPAIPVTTEPLASAPWTATRLLAGYMLMCDDSGVSCVWGELHCNWDYAASFACYDNHDCQKQLLRLGLDMHTSVSERVGIDCSCFNFDGYNFSARTCHEKNLWLRAFSNVKVKLRHQAPNPSVLELMCYRREIKESMDILDAQHPENGIPDEPMLPVRSRSMRIGVSSLNSSPLSNITGPICKPGGPSPGPISAQTTRLENRAKGHCIPEDGGINPYVAEEPPRAPTFPVAASTPMQASLGPPSAKSSPRPAQGVSSAPSETTEYEDVTFVANDVPQRAKESSAASELIVPPLSSLSSLLATSAAGAAAAAGAFDLHDWKSSARTTTTAGGASSNGDEKLLLQAVLTKAPRVQDCVDLQTPRLGKCEVPLLFVKQSSQIDLNVYEDVSNNFPPLPESSPAPATWKVPQEKQCLTEGDKNLSAAAAPRDPLPLDIRLSNWL